MMCFSASKLAKVAPLLTFIYFLVIIFVLLYPFDFDWQGSHGVFFSIGIDTEGETFLVKNSSRKDVIYNIVLFFPFGAFLFASLNGHIESKTVAIVLAVVGAGLVSATCETVQYFSPSRESAVFDLGANILGAIAGACGCWFRFFQTG